MNPFQPAGYNGAAWRAFAEAFDDLGESGGVDARRQVARITQLRPFFHVP
jgi:hypothetical protein